MAIKQTNGNSKSIYLEYSSTAGMLVVSNEATRKILAQARELVGEESWKRGYDGLSGKSVSSQVRKLLAENDITPVTLDGELVAAYYSERQHSNGVYQDIRVKLVDKENGEGYLVTLPLASQAGQMLVRKLANDAVSRGLHISAFSAFPGNGRPDDKTERVFYDSTVQLKNAEGTEIKQADGIFNAAIAEIKAKLKVLEESGIDDREVLNKARASTTVSFYKRVLVSTIEPKFPREERNTESDEPVGKPVAAGSFDEMDGEIPF